MTMLKEQQENQNPGPHSNPGGPHSNPGSMNPGSMQMQNPGSVGGAGDGIKNEGIKDEPGFDGDEKLQNGPLDGANIHGDHDIKPPKMENMGSFPGDDMKPKLENSFPGQDGDPKTPSQIGLPPHASDVPPQSPLLASNNGPPSVPGISQMPPLQPGQMPPSSQLPSQPHPTSSVEAHFMQQQSQIFVFSTKLANQAAQTVQSGQYKSIIDYHMDQPGTKQILQNHPIKNNHLNARLPPTSSGMRNSPMMQENPGGGPPMSAVAQWVQQQNANLQQGGFPSPNNQMNPGNFSPNSGMPPGGMPPGPNGQWPGGPPCSGPSPQEASSPGMMNNMMGPGGPNFNGQMGPNGPNGMSSMQNNLLSNKVPDENLTPEQLQRREEQLASLQKIKAMLFPNEQGGSMSPGPGQMVPGGPGGPPGMMPGGGPGGMPMGPMGPQGNMGPGMGSPGPPPGMMGSPGQMMGPMGGPMGPNNPMGPPFGPQNPPPNFENMTPAQREWFKMQAEFYSEKRRKQEMDRMRQMQQMQQMGMNMPPGQGPPPPYFNRGRPGMGPGGPMSPTSANMNGPFDGPSPPNDAFMMGPRGPGPMNFQRGPGPNFEPGMDPGLPPGMIPDMMRGPSQKLPPMIQRAGNPEQFNPELANSGATKPPPSYAQAQKRKRSGEDIDELLMKKLQPAPSPQQFNYMNQFEGQELTITKQINMAYQEPVGGAQSPAAGGGGAPHSTSQSQPTPVSQSSSQSSQQPASVQSQHQPAAGSEPPTPSTQSIHSPMPPSNTNPPSVPPAPNMTSPLNTSTPSSRPPSVSGQQISSAQSRLSTQSPGQSPGGATTGPTTSTSATSQMSTGANQRLSHFDPPRSKSDKLSMQNITSASLANLAKGVENMTSKIQQNMMQGGPYHNVQVQGADLENGPNGPHPNSSQPPSSHSHPSVNNTFVNANLSIGQVNIQSVNHPNGPRMSGPPGFGNPTMNVQQMNNEQNQMNVHGGHGVPPGGMISQQSQMSQSMYSNEPGMVPPNNKLSRPFPDHSPGMPPTSQMPPSPGMMPSPGFSRSAANPVGNANVKIQAKAPNTIQYLPANPPASPANQMPGPPMRKDMEMPPGGGIPPRFPSPNTSMENRTPTNKFFPGGGPIPGPGGPGPDMLPGGPSPVPHPMGPSPHRMQSMHGPSPPMVMQQGMVQTSGGGMSMGGMQYMGPMGPDGPMGPGDMMGQPGGPPQGSMAGPMPVSGPSMMQMGMRPDSAGMMGPGGPGPGQPGYNAQFQQFQQQLYSRGPSRQMTPGGMGPGGPMMGPNGPMMMGPGGPMRPEMGGGPMGPNGPMMMGPGGGPHMIGGPGGPGGPGHGPGMMPGMGPGMGNPMMGMQNMP